jgi:hypothetical protein
MVGKRAAATLGFDGGEVWRLATALSGAGNPEEVSTAIADWAAAASGAVFANLASFDPKTKLVRVIHGHTLPTAIAERWLEFDIDEPTPLCRAIQTGIPVMLPSLEAIGAEFPLLLEDTVAAGLAATASLPLGSRAGMMMGAIGLGWREPQEFGLRQMSRLTLISQLGAEALERTRFSPPVRRIAADRAEARVLQEAFLPSGLPATDHLEVAAAYLPASDTPMGGDWYDAFPVDGGTCLVIGDVAGHGVPSVSVMAQLRNAVRAFADEDPTPARIVTRVNRMLCRLDPDSTATLIVAVWHPEEETLVHTNAGHPPILRCRPEGCGFVPVGPGNGVMIGADPGRVYCEESNLMRPDTTLLLYTDGLMEARGENLDDSMERLRAQAQGRSDLSPQALCDDVLLWRLMRGPRGDDVCVLAARIV